MKNKEQERVKVLVSAYACEPYRGSEPGVGWNWAKQIARFAEVWVITRANNRDVIEEELKKNPEPNLHFIYVDLPKWMRFWKKGQKGVHLYYYLWQFATYFRARKLTQEIKFDIAHHITFVNDWMFSGLSFLNIPFVWGPIGSNIPINHKFLPAIQYYIFDRIKHSFRLLIRFFDPLFLLTLLKSNKIILISKNQFKLYPFKYTNNSKIIVQQANAVNIQNKRIAYKQKDNVIIYSAGSLIPIKGYHLSIFAFFKVCLKLNEVKYVISGTGFFKKYLDSLIERLNIKNRIIFTGKIERDDVLNLMHHSDIFLFPSFEGGGMVVLEAMASGLPVVCLDYGGPGEMVTEECGIKVKPITFEQTVNDLADALLKLANDPELRKKMGEAGRRRVLEHYTWEKKGEFIKKVYEEVLGIRL